MRMEMQQQQKRNFFQMAILWLKYLLTADFQFTEAQSGFMAMAFGFILLLPFNTFGAAAGYRAMAQLAPEWAWGWYMFTLGMLQMFAVNLGFQRLRRWFLFLLTLSWAFVAAMLGWASMQTNGPYTYGLIALSSAWAYWRLAIRGY